MFGLFKRKSEQQLNVEPNGYYEGEVLSADYPPGDSDEYHDIYAHGSGKLTINMPDGSRETYEGSWDIGRFHGKGTLTITKSDGSVEEKKGIWIEGRLDG